MIGPSAEEIEEKIDSNDVRPLILDLHPEHRGYTVTLPGRNCVDCHTRFFSYELDYELLRHVENGELPSMLTDLIENFCLGRVFYKGCVPIRVRDYRSLEPEYQTLDPGTSSEHHIVNRTEPESYLAFLRPTVQSLTDDLNRLLYDDANLTIEQRRSLESEFWKMISDNLCFEKLTRSDDSQVVLKPPSLARYYEKKRKRRAEFEIIKENELSGFKFIRLQMSTNKSDAQAPLLSKQTNTQIGQWKPMLPSARTPAEIAEKRLSAINEVELDGRRTVAEEYCIEFTSPSNSAEAARCFKTKIVISRRKSDWVYMGELIVDRDATGDSQVRSNFVLGTEYQSKLYISQYLDMVSEGGRRSLTLTRIVPGKPPQVFPAKTCSVVGSGRGQSSSIASPIAAFAPSGEF